MKELSRRKQHVPSAKKNFLPAEHWNFTTMRFMRKKGLLLATFVIQALRKDLNWKPILKEGISMLFENISKVAKALWIWVGKHLPTYLPIIPIPPLYHNVQNCQNQGFTGFLGSVSRITRLGLSVWGFIWNVGPTLVKYIPTALMKC